mmetsp:Transcript_10779/g.34204  ORF Transcript_10779/g.34204 Transcript_10779/m.34204 type:complete len:213 (-) Transcript_10779:870-1508(-)
MVGHSGRSDSVSPRMSSTRVSVIDATSVADGRPATANASTTRSSTAGIFWANVPGGAPAIAKARRRSAAALAVSAGDNESSDASSSSTGCRGDRCGRLDVSKVMRGWLDATGNGVGVSAALVPAPAPASASASAFASAFASASAVAADVDVLPLRDAARSRSRARSLSLSALSKSAGDTMAVFTLPTRLSKPRAPFLASATVSAAAHASRTA